MLDHAMSDLQFNTMVWQDCKYQLASGNIGNNTIETLTEQMAARYADMVKWYNCHRAETAKQTRPYY